MTITTFTIDGSPHISYASEAEADAYLNVDPVREGSWEALSSAVKQKYLVMATRLLDGLTWAGVKTGDYDTQVNQWPRTNVTYKDGSAVSTTEVPTEVANATALLAGDIAISSTAADPASTGSNTKRVKAGSAEVEFFRPTTGVPLANEAAYKLVFCFLSATSLTGSVPGDNAESSFCDDDDNGLSEGYA